MREPGAPNCSATDCRRWLTENDGFVHQVVSRVAARHRLSTDDADELRSIVSLKLVSDEYSVLRRFKGRSSLRTYLTVVVTRVCLDYLIARRGKWRPSAAARRAGATAMRLERLVVRDGWPFAQACDMLRINERVMATDRELEEIAAVLPARQRPRVVGVEEIELLPHPSVPPHDTSPDEDAAGVRTQDDLMRAVQELQPTDRLLVRLRFDENLTIAHIARALQMDQKALYRRFERLLRDLRMRMVCLGRDSERMTA
jgi:RNA polymerase sigma factor (sigma-70 family)